jgi:SsrA-binding protein
MKNQAAKTEEITIIGRNRRATFEYEITESLECGIVLVGTEVKALRDGHCQLEEAYARLDRGELWLIGCEIPEYRMGNQLNHKPKRDRKLLLHRREMEKFAGKATIKGYTLIPLKIYFKNGRAKVEIAIAKGKQLHDKRESMKQQDANREMAREVRKYKR